MIDNASFDAAAAHALDDCVPSDAELRAMRLGRELFDCIAKLVRTRLVSGNFLTFDTLHDLNTREREELLECALMEKLRSMDYSLTYDNIVKMVVIYARISAGIPVMLMGETGCGKTRL